jgi:hypothetical protein
MTDIEKTALKPANENPWYCLATLHGEQPLDRLDQELADKNRSAWQQWIGGVLKSNMRAEFLHAFAGRTGRREPPPEPESAEMFDFSHTHFDRAVHFGVFLFQRPVDFSSATFSGVADFSSATFSGNADFSSATFSANADFVSAIFSNIANFSSATFAKMADFKSATFSKMVTFASVRFSGPAEFESTKFDHAAHFDSATFSEGAGFSLARFVNLSAFNRATFSDSTDFSSATFTGPADFVSATFAREIHFVNAKLAGVTWFSNARFHSKVPDFRGATMHEATEWHGVTWPKPPGIKADAQRQVYAYERLKQEMERLTKHEDEQNFFRRELRARRGLVRVLSGGWLLNLVYQGSSDYGNSIGRPLLWLFGVFAAGTAIFAYAPIHCGAPMPIRLAIKLSFANIFVFLPDKREIMTPEMIACLSDTTRAVSALQSVSGVVLLFLLGLALRNRFRMK